MNESDTAAPAAWGISGGYYDVRGRWVPTSRQGAEAALEAMRPASNHPGPSNTWVVTADETVYLPAPVTLHGEDGSVRRLGAGPIHAPELGYHDLEFEERVVRLIVSPGTCVLPDRRCWGWAAQLYAVLSLIHI